MKTNYTNVNCCALCDHVIKLELLNWRPMYFCNSDDSELPDWDNEDEFSDWSKGRIVNPLGICDEF
jgi:hypothetical protein